MAPTDIGDSDARQSPSTDGTKQKNAPAKRRRAVGAATSPAAASASDTKVSSTHGKSSIPTGMLGGLISAGDGIGHEISSNNSISSANSTNNTSGASSSTSEPSLDSTEGTITVSWHEGSGTGAASRPGAIVKSDPAPQMSYASIAQKRSSLSGLSGMEVDKTPDAPPSQPVTRSRLPALNNPQQQPKDTSGTKMQPLYRLDVATPSSWVEACAAARAEADARLSDSKQCSDSPSEDAFIQSIFRELDLDDDIE